jgi:hypothetical protein
MIADRTLTLQERDLIFAKLVELGISEMWLAGSNMTANEAAELLKGVLYLREMYPDKFRCQ